WAEKAYSNLIYYNRFPKGTHFAAWEQQEYFVMGMRDGFRTLRSSAVAGRADRRRTTTLTRGPVYLDGPTEMTMTAKRVAAFSVCLLLQDTAGARAQGAAAKKSGATMSAAAAKPTIVLVHGAFADASSFQYLIPLLLNDGYN